MKPIKIICLKYGSNRYNLSNIGLRALFGRWIITLQFRRELEAFVFDAFDPAKIGLTKEEDWEVFAQKTKEIMIKVLKIPGTEL